MLRPKRAAKRTAQQAKVILGEALGSLANRPQPASGQIGPAIHVVNHLIGKRVQKQPVDRKVAPLCIFLRGREMHLRRTPAVVIRSLPAKRSHLNNAFAMTNQNDAKHRADGLGVSEEFANALGRRIRGHVVILGREVEQNVAHASAREVGDVPAGSKPLQHRQRIVAQAWRLGAEFVGLAHGRKGYPLEPRPARQWLNCTSLFLGRPPDKRLARHVLPSKGIRRTILAHERSSTMRHLMSIALLASLGLLPMTFGCDREVAHTERTTDGPGGTKKTESTTVQHPDGSVTTEKNTVKTP